MNLLLQEVPFLEPFLLVRLLVKFLQLYYFHLHTVVLLVAELLILQLEH